MHTNGTVIYYDPLNADQPLTVSGDTGTQAGTEGGADTTTTTGTAATGTETGEVNMLGSMLSLIVPLLLMGVVFYFFLIRPQRKKDKAVKNMLDALKTGDRICTIGGIYGTVDRLKDDTVTILVGPEKTKLIMAKWAIRSVENATVENDASPEV
ncbi:MAG: preprotein translocase subunit YajC [Candidatus Fimadaptatus sp.]